MSGHSHWATIRRKKGAADAKRGQVFTRLAREIVIAAREGGGDPDSNMRLAFAIDRARAQNMPKDNIERAIKRGTGEAKEGNAYEEVMYEGYAQHGMALLIACVTDNRNRAVAEIRHVLNRIGGSMAEAGSVVWQFKRIAYFSFPQGKLDQDMLFELAVEAGADDVIFDEGTWKSWRRWTHSKRSASGSRLQKFIRKKPSCATPLTMRSSLALMNRSRC